MKVGCGPFVTSYNWAVSGPSLHCVPLSVKREKLPFAINASTTASRKRAAKPGLEKLRGILRAKPPITLTDTNALTPSHHRADPIDKLVGKVVSWPFG